jgi:dCTP deaminase
MTILVKNNILELINSSKLKFNPALDSFQIQENAIDLRLGFTFIILKKWQITPKGREVSKNNDLSNTEPSNFQTIELEEGQYFELLPNEYILASTLESISLPNDVVGTLYPRSSVNRRGISIDLSGIINAGYEGYLILPIRNNSSSEIARLYPGERICQIMLHQLKESVSHTESKYHKTDPALGPKRDKTTEISLILKGKIRELKSRYKI